MKKIALIILAIIILHTSKLYGSEKTIADLQKDKQFADYTNPNRITHSIYLGKDLQDGDNSDNGHFVIDINCEKIWS